MQLGERRLMCGNATLPEDVARLMDGATADLLVTDPHYCDVILTRWERLTNQTAEKLEETEEI